MTRDVITELMALVEPLEREGHPAAAYLVCMAALCASEGATTTRAIMDEVDRLYTEGLRAAVETYGPAREQVQNVISDLQAVLQGSGPVTPSA